LKNPIHTLNARGNVLLEVIRDTFDLNSEHMFREIQGMHNQVCDTLKSKSINYSDLKNALVPHTDRNEIALFFDTQKIDKMSYGKEVLDRLLPLLNKKSKHSILVGDYIGKNLEQEFLYEEFSKIQIFNSTDWYHSSQYYVVYLNNQTKGMVEQIVDGFKSWSPFIGFANTTYASRLKFILSFSLVHLITKLGKIFIQEHEDDRPNTENINIQFYSPKKFGYDVKSISGSLFGVFLTYKIERPVFGNFQIDTEMAFNALVPNPEAISEFEIFIEDRKLEYLRSEKSGSLKKAELHSASKEQISNLIKQKIANNYIYNLIDEHGCRRFSVILEIKTPKKGVVKLMPVLEYDIENTQLRLITMY